MGCGPSAKVLEETYPDDWIATFEALQFTKNDLVKLENIFGKIDQQNDGKLDLLELLDFLELEKNAFAKRTFAIFDDKQTGAIDFRGFVVTLWNYCSCTDSSLRMFAFDLYDTDGSGKIAHLEVETMMREVYGPAFETNAQAARLLSKAEALGRQTSDNTIGLEAFVSFARDNPVLLYPAFDMQRRIQAKIMGIEFWSKHLERRLQISKDGGHFVSVKQILAMKLNKNIYTELVEKPLEAEAEFAKQRGVRAGVKDEKMQLAIDSSGARVTRSKVYTVAPVANSTAAPALASDSASPTSPLSGNQNEKSPRKGRKASGSDPFGDQWQKVPTRGGSAHSKKIILCD
jgi:Ca2+-binding EF-hand superfamily protein